MKGSINAIQIDILHKSEKISGKNSSEFLPDIEISVYNFNYNQDFVSGFHFSEVLPTESGKARYVRQE